MKYCYAILSKLLTLSQYLNHDVDLHVYRYVPLVEIGKLQYECKRAKQIEKVIE